MVKAFPEKGEVAFAGLDTEGDDVSFHAISHGRLVPRHSFRGDRLPVGEWQSRCLTWPRGAVPARLYLLPLNEAWRATGPALSCDFATIFGVPDSLTVAENGPEKPPNPPVSLAGTLKRPL